MHGEKELNVIDAHIEGQKNEDTKRKCSLVNIS